MTETTEQNAKDAARWRMFMKLAARDLLVMDSCSIDSAFLPVGVQNYVDAIIAKERTSIALAQPKEPPAC